MNLKTSFRIVAMIVIMITLSRSEASDRQKLKFLNNELDNLKTYWNIKSEMRSFKSNENIRKKEGGSYYVVSAIQASSVTL